LGSALAVVKCAQLTENKAKKHVIGTLAIAKGGVATARGIVEQKSQHIGLLIYYITFLTYHDNMEIIPKTSTKRAFTGT
jgi:hypothetical protein